MKFELGKYYKRVDSEKYLFLCGIIDSHVFGMGFIAEDYQKGKHARFSPIGQTEDHGRAAGAGQAGGPHRHRPYTLGHTRRAERGEFPSSL